MSKLREKLYDAIHLEVFVNESGYIDGIQYADEKCEKITEDFAIKFTEWLSGIKYGQLEYFNGSNLKPYEELLQIFKENHYEK